MNSKKPRKSSIEKTVTSDGTVVFSREPTRLEEVPLEYQASLYAKKERERIIKNDAKKKKKLDSLTVQLKSLKEELRNAPAISNLTELKKQIAAMEKAIKKTPRPGRKWSPILPGSFGSKR